MRRTGTSVEADGLLRMGQGMGKLGQGVQSPFPGQQERVASKHMKTAGRRRWLSKGVPQEWVAVSCAAPLQGELLPEALGVETWKEVTFLKTQRLAGSWAEVWRAGEVCETSS